MSLGNYWKKKEERLSGGRYILVLREKDHTSYYDPREWGGLVKLLAHLFRESDKNNGWYPKEPPTDPGPPPEDPPGVTDLELNLFLADRRERHEEKRKKYNESLQEWEAFENARAGDDEQAAFLMELRRVREYEGYDLEALQAPKG